MKVWHMLGDTLQSNPVRTDRLASLHGVPFPSCPCSAHRVCEQPLAGLSHHADGSIHVPLPRQAVDAAAQGLRHRLGHLRRSNERSPSPGQPHALPAGWPGGTGVPAPPTWARRCWLSGSPGLATAFRASSMRLLALSMTSLAHSSMALCACGSGVLAATPRAAWLSERRAWATSRAAIPGERRCQSLPARPPLLSQSQHGGQYLCSSHCPEPPLPGGEQWQS